MIDYEKVYERVEWGFILMMLEAPGFPPIFSHMVGTLIKDVKEVAEVNGDMFECLCSLDQSYKGAPWFQFSLL